jgi:hypothetical protein
MDDVTRVPDLHRSKTWRVRLWIRAGCVLQAVGWIALFAILGVRGNEGPLTWAATVGFVVVVPFLALWPAIRLRPDGALVLRGLTRVRRAHVEEILRLSMTEYGLHFEFADGTTFTSVIFQATHYVKRPRVLEFVNALNGDGKALYDPWDVTKPGGIELYSRRGDDFPRTGDSARPPEPPQSSR